MKIVVVNLDQDLGLAVRSLEVALAAARATEARAKGLVELALASPEQLGKAREIYARATARAKRFQEALDHVMGGVGGSAS